MKDVMNKYISTLRLDIQRQGPFYDKTRYFDLKDHCPVINGQKFLVYSGMSEVGRPDIYLAKSLSGSWEGAWERVRSNDRKETILSHEEVIHHNQKFQNNYEWGLEGAQLTQLPNGWILL